MIKIHNKLVRDNIPAIIEESGKKAKYRVLDQNEYKQALKEKLLEEVNEFLAAKTPTEMGEEIADIEEVVSCLCLAFNITNSYDVRMAKLKSRGSFQKRYFLESVRVDE